MGHTVYGPRVKRKTKMDFNLRACISCFSYKYLNAVAVRKRLAWIWHQVDTIMLPELHILNKHVSKSPTLVLWDFRSQPQTHQLLPQLSSKNDQIIRKVSRKKGPGVGPDRHSQTRQETQVKTTGHFHKLDRVILTASGKFLTLKVQKSFSSCKSKDN